MDPTAGAVKAVKNCYIHTVRVDPCYIVVNNAFDLQDLNAYGYQLATNVKWG